MLFCVLVQLRPCAITDYTRKSGSISFHKRKRQIQEKKLKANTALAARKQKPVIRNSLKETHSANNIVHNDVNIADLQKQISDLKEIVCTHVLKNKKEECYNSLFSD